MNIKPTDWVMWFDRGSNSIRIGQVMRVSAPTIKVGVGEDRDVYTTAGWTLASDVIEVRSA